MFHFYISVFDTVRQQGIPSQYLRTSGMLFYSIKDFSFQTLTYNLVSMVNFSIKYIL